MHAIKPTGVYTVIKAAEALSVDTRFITKSIRSGELPAKKLGQGYRIVGENLLRFAGSISFYGPKTQLPTP